MFSFKSNIFLLCIFFKKKIAQAAAVSGRFASTRTARSVELLLFYKTRATFTSQLTRAVLQKESYNCRLCLLVSAYPTDWFRDPRSAGLWKSASFKVCPSHCLSSVKFTFIRERAEPRVCINMAFMFDRGRTCIYFTSSFYDVTMID